VAQAILLTTGTVVIVSVLNASKIPLVQIHAKTVVQRLSTQMVRVRAYVRRVGLENIATLQIHVCQIRARTVAQATLLTMGTAVIVSVPNASKIPLVLIHAKTVVQPLSTLMAGVRVYVRRAGQESTVMIRSQQKSQQQQQRYRA
jgi:hypothetical protein